MEYGCQTISTKIYPLLKEHIFPNLNLNFKDEYAPAKELYNHLGLKYNSIDANGENRNKLPQRVTDNFERISNNLGLYDVDGKKRPMYVFRHLFISQRRSKGFDSNVVSLNSNTSVTMINKYYQTLNDSNLLDIHNQLFPERTTNTNHKNIKKK